MTQQKHLKQLVRARMAKTGERYAAARRQIIGQPDATSPASFHYPGNIPATTALRTLLAASGLRDPKTSQPLTEAMLFGIAGGIGIGVFAFFYEKENFASLFIAGRHLWQDDAEYLNRAVHRIGVVPTIHETGSTKAAATALREVLAEGGRPAIAWVDAGSLPHRAMPKHWQGGGYHVVTVHALDETAGTATIGDLTDELITISLTELAAARARIAKQKHRLFTLPDWKSSENLNSRIQDGLYACHLGLTGAEGIGNAKSNFSLATLKTLATRMVSTKDKERWEHVFARGPRLWTGLTSLNDFIEHYGTGGGLSRPLFADFLAEAAVRLKDKRLEELSTRYADLGIAWSALADAALPDEVPLMNEAKELLAHKAELLHSGAAPEEVHADWSALAALSKRAEKFPLSETKCADLRADLSTRLMSIYESEVAAHDALGAVVR